MIISKIKPLERKWFVCKFPPNLSWFKSLCLCVSAGNKIQHTYPCTLNFRDFSCVSWLLKMRHVHHIHGFVTIAPAFGETRRKWRKRRTEVFWGEFGVTKWYEITRKNFCGLSLCVSVSLREIKSNTTTSVSNGRWRYGLRWNAEEKENGDTEKMKLCFASCSLMSAS